MNDLSEEIRPFGNYEEKVLISFLIEFPESYAQFHKFLKPQVFVNQEAKYLIAVIEQEFKINGFVPPRGMLLDKLQRSLTVEDPHEAILSIITTPLDHRAVVMIKDHLKEWLAYQIHARIYSDEAISAHARGDYSIMKEVQRELDELKYLGNQRGRDEYDCNSLMSEFPKQSEPLIEGVLRRGEVFQLSAHPKVGKSWMVYSMIRSILTGSCWLSSYATKKGKVLLIDNELMRETLSFRLKTVCGELDPKDLANLKIWPMRNNPQSVRQIQRRLMALKPGDFDLIIIDAKYKLAAMEEGADENGNTAETKFQMVIGEICEYMGASLGLIHHYSRGDQSDKRQTDKGAGAGAGTRSPDTIITIDDHVEEGCATIEFSTRSFRKPDSIGIRFEFPDWKVDATVDPAKKARPTSPVQEAKDQGYRRTILTALDSHGPLTQTALIKKCHLDRDIIRRMVRILLDASLITEQNDIFSLTPQKGRGQ